MQEGTHVDQSDVGRFASKNTTQMNPRASAYNNHVLPNVSAAQKSTYPGWLRI